MVPPDATARRYRQHMTDANKQQQSETSAVVIRMPADLHRAVKEKAAKEERSMAQAIRFALRQYASI